MTTHDISTKSDTHKLLYLRCTARDAVDLVRQVQRSLSQPDVRLTHAIELLERGVEQTKPEFLTQGVRDAITL